MRRARVVVAVAVAVLAVPSVASADKIRVKSTTDTVDAGLVEGLLRAAYHDAQPGDELDYSAVGTGRALTDAQNGLADVVITHAPTLEAQFVASGYSIGLGRQIFYSDYVIVGSKDDPAGVGAKHPHDAIGALEDIATAGDATPDAVRFKSRGDNSGTNVQEQLMWHMSNVTPKQTATAASNPNGDPTRSEPGTGGVYPPWYIKATVPTGQAENLNQTEACVAAGNGCYTMLDRGTFNKGVNGGTITHLKIVSQRNTPSARGGENLLINPFSVYLVNPDRITTNPKPNVAAARRFADFLVSAGFQKKLESFPTAIDPAFLPDAAPAVNLDAPLPQTATAGTVLTASGSVYNRLPGSASIPGGVRLTLQRSTDGGATWTDVASDSANGRFRIDFPVATTAAYRLTTPAHPASNYNELSASSQDLGTVAVPTPSGGTNPGPGTSDTKAPLASKVKLGRKGISLRVSEESTIKLVISKRGRSGRFVGVQTIRLKATKARVVSAKHKTLKAGKYRVRVTVTDAAGNHRTITRSFTLH